MMSPAEHSCGTPRPTPRGPSDVAGVEAIAGAVSGLDRRGFLVGVASAMLLPPAVATVAVARSEMKPAAHTVAAVAHTAPLPTPAAQGASPAGAAPLLPPPPPSARIALPGNGVLSVLPGNGDLLALTLDDGVDSDVVRRYTQFARDTGVRLTYFVNGTYRSWTDNAALLRPLVESAQIQLGNHTWSHPDLTRLAPAQMADEIRRNDAFLTKTFGIDARPFLRPPYGRHNPAVDTVAADLGYTVTTMWSGSLADSTVITEDYIVTMADTYFRPQNIVIGHLNHPPVTHVYGQLVDIIRNRGLRTVTLNDVFLRPANTS
jgi:peptidoglycan-N-acetylglucosamine deacetylase